MKRIVILVLLFTLIPFRVSALEISPPDAPESAQEYMPKETETFSEGLWYVIKQAISRFQPSVAEAVQVGLSITAVVILSSILRNFSNQSKYVVDLVAAICISLSLVQASNSMIHLGVSTVNEITQYGKLLIPAMTAALAAQGGINTSTALYAGTAVLNTVLSIYISNVIIPMIYIYMVLCIACGAIHEDVLKRLKDLIKWIITWSLKIVLYVFTGFLSITGVISGTTDAATLKATKLAVSGAVPVVGNIIADASDTILASAGVVKNAVGIYGLLAIAAIWVEPFLRIGAQYLLLKLVAAVCGIMGEKQTVSLVDDFAGIMGFLVAMTGTVCILLLVSTICYLKGGS